jgi:hypothetical protein
MISLGFPPDRVYHSRAVSAVGNAHGRQVTIAREFSVAKAADYLSTSEQLSDVHIVPAVTGLDRPDVRHFLLYYMLAVL